MQFVNKAFARRLESVLLRARTAAAVAAGCEYAAVVTQGGTTSQRTYGTLEAQVEAVGIVKIELLHAVRRNFRRL